MTLLKKLKNKRGFTLAELLIVIAMIAILSGIAFMFVNPHEISYIEYNRSAEAIAAAAQNRLTEIRNSGDMSFLRTLGEQPDASMSADTSGGYRYVFSYSDEEGEDTYISYICPFGSLEYDIANGYYAIGFQSDTGMVGEVFYSTEPFKECSVEYLNLLKSDPELRKSLNIGYYVGEVDEEKVAFANLPTPQLTITNYEELSLSIYLPEVSQLEKYGKSLGVIVSLADKDGKAYQGDDALDIKNTAIYATFNLGGFPIDSAHTPIVVPQTLESGSTYKIILDTVKNTEDMDQPLIEESLDTGSLSPIGRFEDWANLSGAFEKYFLLGENVRITVTVYCLSGDPNSDFCIDPTFMPRSASAIFNGWFNDCRLRDADAGEYEVDIACGRHLQNLGKLAELRPKLLPFLPKYEETNGVYSYGDYNYGMASTYTDGSSNIDSSINEDHPDYKTDKDPNIHYDDVTNKYARRKSVVNIMRAKQVDAIDFDCAEWKDSKGNPIPFSPICLYQDFRYYGNYLMISHLFVNAPTYAGLFGYMYHERLYDILLVNPTVTSQMPAHMAELYEMGVGALVGTSRDSSHITNCQVYMTSESGEYKTSYRVTGEYYVGGLIGFCEDEHIANCSASVYTGYGRDAKKQAADGTQVPVSSHFVGGLIGCITGDSTLTNCYAAGNLSGDYVGGLVGYIVQDSDPSGDDYSIETCYTAGHIEFATIQAAGILGCVSELAGNAKSALNIYGNYCVIIYGEEKAGKYEWQDRDVPIYGTFEGDGFEWIMTDTQNISGDVYIKAKYADRTYFAGARFANENKNYYIAQEGITYSNSSYYRNIASATEKLLKDITDNKSLSASELKKKVTAAKEKIFWLKKIETLEQLKATMEQVIYEVECETGKDINGNAYNLGGYSSHGPDIWLDLKNCEIQYREKDCTDGIKVTVVQAIHVIYDGTYTHTDESGNVITEKKTITDENHPEISDYTFMGIYNALKGAYTDLADDSSSNDAAAQTTLTNILGNNENEYYFDTYDNKNRGGYLDSRFYRSFYANMFYKLFDKAKDYYQDNVKDKNGELVYRHFREDLLQDRFLDLMCDLWMSEEGRETLLERAKETLLDPAIEAMKEHSSITEAWKKTEYDEKGNQIVHPMKDYADTVKGYADKAVLALETLKALLEGKDYTRTQLESAVAAAKNALVDLYEYYDDTKTNDGKSNIKDLVDVIDKKGNTGGMRSLRDPIENYYAPVELCAATANSGVEDALAELEDKLGETGANTTELVNEFEKKVNIYLGTIWGGADSGHKLFNSTQLLNVVRGFTDTDDSDETKRDTRLGFMYDYNEKSYSGQGTNPYYDTNYGGDKYVNADNGIYNNVFPYTENDINKQYTRYYPFPFVFGEEIENTSNRVVFVLFHYGDWLTEDLWAKDSVTSAINDIDYQLQNMMTYLQDIPNSDTTGSLKNKINPLVNAIESCAGEVNNILSEEATESRKTKLDSVCATITGWLGEKGCFPYWRPRRKL